MSLAVVLVLSAILFAVFGGHLLDTGMGDAEFGTAVNALLLSPAVMFWTFAAGAVATVLGAYTTARIARGALFQNTVGLPRRLVRAEPAGLRQQLPAVGRGGQLPADAAVGVRRRLPREPAGRGAPGLTGTLALDGVPP